MQPCQSLTRSSTLCAAPFLEYGSVDYVHTSGGRTTAHSDRIRAQEPGNLLTWAELHRLAGRGIIADTGYGVGGKLTDDTELYEAWTDPDHLRDRIADGVVGVTFANPAAGWDHAVGRLRATLPPAKHCFGTRSSRRLIGHLAAGNASNARGARGSHTSGVHHPPLAHKRLFRSHAGGVHSGGGYAGGGHADGGHAGGGHHPVPRPILTTRAHEHQREMNAGHPPTGAYVLDGSHESSDMQAGGVPFSD